MWGNIVNAFNSIDITYYYVFCAVLFLVWFFCALAGPKALKRHVNAVTLDEVSNIIRLADKSVKQTDKLLVALSNKKNDISVIFYLYCRIYPDFSNIKKYLNYKFFKRINKKKKPWIFSAVTAVIILLVGLYCYNRIVGFKNTLPFQDPGAFALAVCVPAGMLLLWLFFFIWTMRLFNTYWLEFINIFNKINVRSEEFFVSQANYYYEFSNKVLDECVPSRRSKQYIERIIVDIDFQKANPDSSNYIEEDALIKPKPIHATNRVDGNVAVSAPMQYFPGQNIQVLKPHPESAAYLAAQTQMSNQMMQILMQQNAQQSALIQKALASQQSLAQGVIEQNIMAMRLDAQDSYLKRNVQEKQQYTSPAVPLVKMEPDLAAAELRNKVKEEIIKDGKVTDNLLASKTKEITKATEPEETAPKTKHAKAEEGAGIMSNRKKGAAADKQAEVVGIKEIVVPADAGLLLSDEEKIMSEEFIKAFSAIKKDPSADRYIVKTEDIKLLAPKRDQTNIEKRLGAIFGGSVYKYKKGEYEDLYAIDNETKTEETKIEIEMDENGTKDENNSGGTK